MSSPLFPVAVGLCQERRRTGDEQSHVGGRARAQIRALQQTNVEGRDAHQHGRSRHRSKNSFRVELLHEQDARTRGERYVASHEQPVDMIDRQGVDQNVSVRVAPLFDQRQGVRDQIAMRQHGSF